jgi:hypothetical protein
MHLLHSTGCVSDYACSLPLDEIEVLACFELKMLAFRKIEPCQDSRNDLVDIPIDGGSCISSGLWSECHRRQLG